MSNVNWYVTLAKQIEQLRRSEKGFWFVALSGGVDSVLLLQLLQQACRYADSPDPLIAIHINHGISPNADKWQTFCRSLCEQLSVPLRCVTLELNGQHSENSARVHRWRAFSRVIANESGSDSNCNPRLWLAHHLDDQLETMLFNCFRGTGLAGLSAMSVVEQRDRYRLHRPLLRVTKNQLIQAARELSLQWIEDDSNHNLAYTRNYLRHTLLPVIAQRFPNYQKSFAKLNSHIKQTQLLVDDLAKIDLNECRNGSALSVSGLLKKTRHRQINVFRFWLRSYGIYSLPEAKLNEFFAQLSNYRSESKTQLQLEDHVVLLFNGEIFCVHNKQLKGVEQVVVWPPHEEKICFGDRFIRRRPGNQLRCPRDNENVTVRTRREGDQCRYLLQGKTKTLKKLFNELKIPYWQRNRTPLIFYNDRLVYIVGYGPTSEGALQCEVEGWCIDISEPNSTN